MALIELRFPFVELLSDVNQAPFTLLEFFPSIFQAPLLSQIRDPGIGRRLVFIAHEDTYNHDNYKHPLVYQQTVGRAPCFLSMTLIEN